MAQIRSRDDDDLALLQELQSDGNPDGPFQRLYQRYRVRLLAFFSKRGFGRETCRELSQETFFRVYQSRRSFRGEVPLASWIFQIASNLAKNELRRRHSSKRRGQENSIDDDAESQPLEIHTGGDPSPGTTAAQPLARTLAREKVDALRQALAQLPTRMRRTWQMSAHHEYSNSEIAAIMKVSESTVKVQLHKARKRLRQALADRFGEPLF